MDGGEKCTRDQVCGLQIRAWQPEVAFAAEGGSQDWLIERDKPNEIWRYNTAASRQ